MQSPREPKIPPGGTKGREQIEAREDNFNLVIPGAFPSSPPLSPRLAPLERDESVPVSAFQQMDIDIAESPELPTELGSHLHPRRPAKFVSASASAPRRTRRPSTPRTPIRRPAAQDDMAIDDPWNRQASLFERLPFGRPVSAVQLFSPKPRPIPANRIASIYATEWEKRARESAALEGEPGRTVRIVPQGPAVRELSWDWMNQIKRAMKAPQSMPVAKSISGDALYQRDIATCINHQAWLNDEIINSYLGILIHYLRESTGNLNDKPLFHAFNTFFFSTLRDKGYQGVRRWASRAKIGGEGLLDVDTVFIPVHGGAHWTLMVVRPMERTIEYLDSMGSRGANQVKKVKEWLRGELGMKYDEDEWTVLKSNSSMQDNGSDCGVFLLTNAKAIALGVEPTAFGASDTILLRRKIVAEIMNGGLNGEFSPINKEGLLQL
ncbi:hypothetical protein N7448_009281 [Penicillium atrosanguineum]|uniref:uncharacterized protein n=1 Tax=Penicillium atrosanguineum TaxID=1132637 RepID=UPI00238BFE12|nr:uncharacterized protein N7443_006530 [Penicillium atrosanguineum]KAJ5123184.1 hypothetical protein N7448_009281 [Penicillium atrosanguineum]KAJ5298410.1 hypothetical protein N7443_006530 [Penicillium atrosanguineum]